MSVFGLKNLVLLNPVCPTEYKKQRFEPIKMKIGSKLALSIQNTFFRVEKLILYPKNKN